MTAPLSDVVFTNNAIIEIGLGDHFTETSTTNSNIVEFSTNAPLTDNNFFVELYDNTPITVDNFLAMLQTDPTTIALFIDLSQTLLFRWWILRSLIPGSGHFIPTMGTIQNESGNLNTRGTIRWPSLVANPTVQASVLL